LYIESEPIDLAAAFFANAGRVPELCEVTPSLPHALEDAA
jgi:hypothetical protein